MHAAFQFIQHRSAWLLLQGAIPLQFVTKSSEPQLSYKKQKEENTHYE